MIKELFELSVKLFAILGVIFLGYVLVEGMAYHALVVFFLGVGLASWRYWGGGE